MEKYFLDHDIRVLYVEASSFPEGVAAAHQQLHSLLSSTQGRNFFGISAPTPSGKIVYKAAVEAQDEKEVHQLKLPTFVIRKGDYISTTINHYMQNLPSINEAFQQLLKVPEINPEGYCLETYEGEDQIKCMVPLDPFYQDRRYLSQALHQVFRELKALLASLDDDQLNQIPFTGSWTAAQVGEHLAKSYKVHETLNGKTAETQKPAKENVEQIKELFLNFDIKMDSPDFIIPSEGRIDQSVLMTELDRNTSEILKVLQTKDLSKVCLDFELPETGYITRLEWCYFILYHSMRHVHQLKKIMEVVQKNSLVQ